MIPIEKQPEPPDFFDKVQKLGEEFLAQHPETRGSKLPPYWRAVIPDLRKAYRGICAYTCHWIPPDTGWNTIDHFKPKERYPYYAYRWDNYQLVCGIVNGRKGTNENVLDPFTLQEGWFSMHFPSLQLITGKHLIAEAMKQVEQTIKILKLNDSTCIHGRRAWLQPYLDEEYGITYLEGKAPFLASELKRQNLTDVNLPIWEHFRKAPSKRLP